MKARDFVHGPPIYSPYICAFAIKKYCIDYKIEYMTLLDCPKVVYKYLKEMDSYAEFIFKEKHYWEQYNSPIYQKRIFKIPFNMVVVHFLIAINKFYSSKGLQYSSQKQYGS